MKIRQRLAQFWQSLKKHAPDIYQDACGLKDAVRRVEVRCDDLTNRPLDDDDATRQYRALLDVVKLTQRKAA